MIRNQVANSSRAFRNLFAAGLSFAMVFAGGCADLTGGGGPGRCGDPRWTPAPDDPPPSINRSQAATPLIVLRLDQHGLPCNRDAFVQLAKLLRDGPATDVYVICPGWSSGYASAVGWSRTFLTGVEKARVFAEADSSHPRPYRPVYICVSFPADVLVGAFPAPPVDGGRRLRRTDANQQAIADVLGADIEPDRFARVRTALLERGHKPRARRLEELMGRAALLTPPELVDLADCLLPLFGPQETPSAPGPRFAATIGKPPVPRIGQSPAAGLLEVDPSPLPPIDPQELLEVWKQAAREVSGDVARGPEQPGDDSSRARRRGLRVVELARWAIRAADLHLMKDFAWEAGQVGVGELLDRLKAAPGSPAVHLVGHSLGCEAILSGLSRTGTLVTPAHLASAATQPATGPAQPTADGALAETVLLLQPTVSAWSFAPAPPLGSDVAPTLAGLSRPGAYRPSILGRVRRSVVVTRSTADWVLSYYANRALRTPPIEGQVSADSWAGEGLGSVLMGAAGPLGVGPVASHRLIPVTGSSPPASYLFAPTARLVTIEATDMLYSHGDINEPAYWWLLANQVEQK